MITYLNERQLEQLRNSAKNLRDWLLIVVQYETGCTVSELVLIKREDIKHNSIQVANRQCIVSTNLINKSREFLKGHSSPYLFPSRQKPYMTTKRVQQIIREYLQNLNFPGIDKHTPHLLRYTHIAHAVKQNIPFKAIQEQTGLKELRLSQIVASVTPSEQKGYGRMFR